VTRIYFDSFLQVGSPVQISSAQELHLIKVLRMRDGDHLIAFNQSQGEFDCSLVRLNQWQALPLEHIRDQEKPTLIEAGIALIKKERLKFAVEAATQLGCDSIKLLNCDRSQANGFSKDKVLKQVIGSVEQSGRCLVPFVEACSLEEFITGSARVLCANELSKQELLELHPLELPISILVGPEGGFSPGEQELLLTSKNVTNISLGSHILRSEVALASLLSQLTLKLRG
jgi:16S rRNA (uracil1498-N3)-methyltransferase